MRAPLYRLVEGPEWQGSVNAAHPGDERFDDNIAALRLSLEYGAYDYSRPLIEDHDLVRIATTKDVAAGYRLVAGIKIELTTVTLGWLDLEWLADD